MKGNRKNTKVIETNIDYIIDQIIVNFYNNKIADRNKIKTHEPSVQPNPMFELKWPINE